MKEQFVPYEIALKLKEKGFDEPCIGWWHSPTNNEHNLFLVENGEAENNNIKLDPEQPDMKDVVNWKQICEESKLGCSAPLWQQVIDWLEDKFSYHIVIYPIREFWEGDIRRITGKVNPSFYRLLEATYSSRKDAQYALINEALKHIK